MMILQYEDIFLEFRIRVFILLIVYLLHMKRIDISINLSFKPYFIQNVQGKYIIYTVDET